MKRVVALIALTVVSASMGCHGSPVAPIAPPEVKATVATLAKTPVDIWYEAVGTVRAKTSSTIQSKVMGHVTAVHVKEGDLVQPSQVLVEIDDRETLAQVQRAEGGLREAQETRQEVEKAILAAGHAKTAAEAGDALALATYERFKALAEKQAVSRQAFDEARAKQEEAAAESARAGEMALSVQAKRGEADARIEQAQAELTNARTFLSYTKIVAPFAGIVTRKTVDVGDLAAPGAVLLEVEDTGQYRLEALVDEALVRRAKQGDKAPVVLDGLGAEELPGTVAEIVPSADPASRTFVVKIDLPQEPSVKSGMFGRARFSMGQKETLTVPVSAIVQRGQLTGVYVVGGDNVARLRLVTIGKRYGDRIEALSGLQPGERIAADNVEQVVDGCVVPQG
jgi:multidrug efflux pump subunit AcrA (membrane-fusion protein)